MTIGEKRPEKIKDKAPAPGEYSPDEKLTKPSTRTTTFQNQTGREQRDESADLGPGAYQNSNEFGKDLK